MNNSSAEGHDAIPAPRRTFAGRGATCLCTVSAVAEEENSCVREDNAVMFQPVVVKLRLAAAGELATEHVPVARVNRR
jgi:hypothetical protein